MYDNFLFRKSWWDVIKGLPDEQRCEVIDTITQFIFEDVEPRFEEPTAVSMAVQFIIRDIARDKEYYIDTTDKRKEAGKLGGAPKGNQNARKTTKNNQNNQNNQVVFENNQKQANKQNKPYDIDKDKNNNTTTPPPSFAPAPVHARESLARWIAESELAEWARLKFSQNGYFAEIDIGALLDEFFDNDFTVRERCERGERMDVLKHFQNWLPKYINKLKNEQNNGNNHTNTPPRTGQRTVSLDGLAQSILAGCEAGRGSR